MLFREKSMYFFLCSTRATFESFYIACCAFFVQYVHLIQARLASEYSAVYERAGHPKASYLALHTCLTKAPSQDHAS